ncbi:MAG TPA: GYD domain-containing protein [Myxococcaceae bacterium]|nr:GYD domain-containing protein [Myxococcaceae bacterium]
MQTYVLMTKLGPSESGDPRERRKKGQAWKRTVEALCPGIRWVAHYALLGPYDFMDIYEAPDEETAFKISLLSRAEGAITAESWPAARYEEFLRVSEEVQRAEDAVQRPKGKRRKG